MHTKQSLCDRGPAPSGRSRAPSKCPMTRLVDLGKAMLPRPIENPFAPDAQLSERRSSCPIFRDNEQRQSPSLFSRLSSLGNDLGERLRRLPGQLRSQNPFSGDIGVERLPLFKSIVATVRNIRNPLGIIDRAFASGTDYACIDIPGFSPVLYVRDPEMIKEILTQTGIHKGFERDGLETNGIGRIVGDENLLRAQGEEWKIHKQALAKPLGMGAVGTPEMYAEMEAIIRGQLDWLEGKVRAAGGKLVIELEPVIKTAMLEILSKTMFGVELGSSAYREKYLPAIERVIEHILLDTVNNPFNVERLKLPAFTSYRRDLKRNNKVFEELVDLAIAQRRKGGGLWSELPVQGTDEAVRSNVKVLLAGALEATASYISWTIARLSRNIAAQTKARGEANAVGKVSEATRRASIYLQQCLDEALRLHASLYLLPRKAKEAVSVKTAKGILNIPKGVHIILATYHAGRNEKYWGVKTTGYPADGYVPERWNPGNMEKYGVTAATGYHFGFGHGARACSGKSFAQVEAFVGLNSFLRRFKVAAINEQVAAVSGVSTRPNDKVLVEVELV